MRKKKVMQASMPIANIKLVMMASVAILTAQHFPRKFDNWEGLPSASCVGRRVPVRQLAYH
jgi:hypothetical protein